MTRNDADDVERNPTMSCIGRTTIPAPAEWPQGRGGEPAHLRRRREAVGLERSPPGSAMRLPLAAVNVPFLLLALVTINLGTRIAIKVPHVKGQINLSAAFVFLSLLLFDGEAATLLALLAAFCATLIPARRATGVDPLTLLKGE